MSNRCDESSTHDKNRSRDREWGLGMCVVSSVARVDLTIPTDPDPFQIEMGSSYKQRIGFCIERMMGQACQ